MGLLNEDGIELELNKLDIEWGVIAGTTLTRVYKFKDFARALAFTNKIGAVAEKMGHHPEICLEWGKVEVRITTHSEGGITDKDFQLADKIDSIK